MLNGYEDRWYQSEAENAVFDYFEERRGIKKPANPVVAMPTGTGKSHVIAKIVTRALRMHPLTRIMMLTHVKELISQNAEKLLKIWPTAPLGIHSHGLNQKDTAMPIIYGGVGTVKNRVEHFGRRDLLLIDEAHLLSPNSETMYQKIIAQLLAVNPWLRVIGFTATPYRMRQGMITDDGIFTDICYDVTGMSAFNRLIAEGYICPPIAKRTDAYIDVDNVGIDKAKGDFKEGELEHAADEITMAAVKETMHFGYNRRCWLMFASGIKHAENIAEMLRMFGVPAAAVHSKLKPEENDARIKAFKRGELRAIVNMGKLTTGFDFPPIDLIGMLRPTLSPGLWVQMVGRGTRTYDPFCADPEIARYFPGIKSNLLLLDFARNTPRLGPINDPIKPRKPGEGGGNAPVRQCDNCGCYNHASARFCINCGYEFAFETKIVRTAGTESPIRDDENIVRRFEVSRVIYSMHEAHKSGNRMIKVMYFCGYQCFTEFMNFESSSGYVKHKAHNWWRLRSRDAIPESNDEVLSRTNELRFPSNIRVQMNKDYPEIVGHEF